MDAPVPIPSRRAALCRISSALFLSALPGLSGCGGDDNDDDGRSNTGRSKREIAELINNLKQIGIAAHGHATARRGEFPSDYLIDGQPSLSWRVKLLPYLEQTPLFREIRTDEPWDSESNKKLVEQMPRVFYDSQCRLAGHTPFLFPVGRGTLHDPELLRKRRGRGVPLASVTDGLTYTVLAVKVIPDLAVPWTKPADHAFDSQAPFAGLELIEGKHVVLFADGHVARLDRSLPRPTQQAIFTPAGGETVRGDDL